MVCYSFCVKCLPLLPFYNTALEQKKMELQNDLVIEYSKSVLSGEQKPSIEYPFILEFVVCVCVTVCVCVLDP